MTELRGGGAAGELIRGLDWASSPLGAIETWSIALRTALGILLNSRFPMFLWWGPELIQFYNDAYTPSFGQGKHPPPATLMWVARSRSAQAARTSRS